MTLSGSRAFWLMARGSARSASAKKDGHTSHRDAHAADVASTGLTTTTSRTASGPLSLLLIDSEILSAEHLFG
jgi:hypothetical protein